MISIALRKGLSIKRISENIFGILKRTEVLLKHE